MEKAEVLHTSNSRRKMKQQWLYQVCMDKNGKGKNWKWLDMKKEINDKPIR